MSFENIMLGICFEYVLLYLLINVIELKLDIQVVELLGLNQLVYGKIIGLESEQDFIVVIVEILFDVY